MKQSGLSRAQCNALFGFAGKGRRPRPGRFAIQPVFVFLIALVVVAKVSAAPAYPLRASANGRYLVDSNNAPFLVIGDAPHSIIVNLSSADAATYLINRGTNGFNALWIELLCDSYTGGPGTEGAANYGHDLNGNNPFTNTLSGGYYDLTKPNPTYWSHVDYIVNTAATNGLQCFFTPLDQGGWTATSLANGSNNCYTYGQFLGSRYASSPNIFWNMGNDFQNWSTPTNDSVILAIAKGILSKDTNHLLTIELNYQVSQSLDDPNWQSVVTVNGVYTYYDTYAESYAAWNKTNMPVLFLEGNYEFENNTGQQPSSPLVLRLQEYWSILSGCLGGHMYGNHYTWANWNFSYLNTTGAVQLAYCKNFFTNRAWYNLVPDQNHHLVTAGYGISNSTSFVISTNNYATAAVTADGTLGMVYCPTNATVTVVMTNFIGPVTSRWFDPSANTFTTIAGSPFANTITTNLTTPGVNAGGDHDWVLLLEDQPPPLIPPQITAAAFNGNNFVVSFSTVLGQKYELQNTTVLGSGSWLSVVTNIPGTGGIVQAADTNAASQFARFYRVKTGLAGLSSAKPETIESCFLPMNLQVAQVSKPVYPESFRGWSPTSKSAGHKTLRRERVWKPTTSPERLRGTQTCPSPLRFDVTAPKPEAKAGKSALPTSARSGVQGAKNVSANSLPRDRIKGEGGPKHSFH